MDHRYHIEAGHTCEFVVRSPVDWSVIERLPTNRVEQFVISPDASQLVGRIGSSLLAWNANNLGATPQKIRGGKLHFTGIAFHPSGRYLAATNNDQTVKLYDTTTWELAKTFTWDIGRMRSIAFSPDGALAAAGSDTGKVVVWDVDV
jgi:WD40 repeat protein